MFHATSLAFATSTPVAPRAELSRGLLAGTQVETATGWRPAGALRPGEMVHTLDGGLRPLRAVDRNALGAGEGAVLRIPGGLLGAAVTRDVPAGQPLLIVHEAVDRLFALPAAQVLAWQLDGVAGCHRRPAGVGQEAIQLHFDEEEIVWADEGLLMPMPGAGAGFFPLLDSGRAARLACALARAFERGAG